jgi:P4 family phage/plasmid primase-like protien
MSAITKFLNSYKVKSGSQFTHTSLKGGSFYVPTDDVEKFMEIYKVALANGEDLHLTEKHRDTSPILVDLDFRQSTPDRLYTYEHIVSFLTALKKQITDYIEVSDNMLQFFILEKHEARKNKSGGFKDGIHIMCPYITTKAEVQHIIRQNMIRDEMKIIFDNTFTNSYDDIYDEAVIEKNNWFMYGSKKPDEEYPWVVNKVYDANLQEVDYEHDDETFVDLLSIRNKFDDLPLKADKVDEVKAYKESKQKPKSEEDSTSKAYIHSPSNYDTIEKLVMMLKPERADDYHDWIKIGMCLKGINMIYKIIWIEFSKQSSKFKEEECERVWKTLTPKGEMTEGSLRRLAKEDNPEKYRELRNADLRNLILKSINETHTDIAHVAHFLFKDEIVCCYANEKPFWYVFEKHRWVETPDGIALKLKISRELVKEYNLESSRHSLMASKVEEDDEQKRFAEIAKKLSSIAMKLKTAQFKGNVFKECKELFYVSSKDFYEKLDENKYLLGFNNGVYDFKSGCFRAGQPNDLLTYTVGYDYVTNFDDGILANLNKLLTDIFPPDILPFMINTCSYAVCGNKFMECFQFWNGVGANGKGLFAKLLEYALGDYYYQPDVTVVTTKKKSSSSANDELAKMKGKRLVIATEPSEGDKFLVGQLKAWTGGDSIQARSLYKSNIEFEAQFLLVIQMNKQPALSDFDKGIARRIINVPFERNFVTNPQLPNQRLMVDGLKDIFREDVRYRQAFMALILQNYVENLLGNRRFDIPESVKQHTQAYLEANDKVKTFLTECCDVTNNKDDMIQSKELYEMFKASDYNDDKTKDQFLDGMKMHGFQSVKCKKRNSGNLNKYVFEGIKYKSQEFEIEEDDEVDPLA